MNYIKKIVFVTAVVSSLLLSLVYAAQAQQVVAKLMDTGCMVECRTCASTCKQTLNYCLKHGGEHINLRHLKVLQDCLSTCKQSTDFMDRNSALQNSACALCEKACLSCAESCAAFKGDKTMQACAEECRKCARSCHSMAK